MVVWERSTRKIASSKQMLLQTVKYTLQRPEYKITTERNCLIQFQGQQIVEYFERTENHEKCETFAVKLMCEIDRILLVTGVGVSSKKQDTFIEFHQFRVTKLRELWKEFSASIGMCDVMIDPLLYQSVTEKLFSEAYKEQLEQLQKKTKSTTKPTTNITTDEENLIRYIAGFVPFKVLQQIKKRKSTESKLASFAECLDKMGIDGPEESLLEYTTEWTQRIDRGALFKVSDTAFMLFKQLDIRFRDTYLPILQQPSTSSPTTKSDMISCFIEDEDVQFYWALLSVDIELTEDSNELLKLVVDKWLNIRCFSAVKMFSACYEARKSTKKIQSSKQKKVHNSKKGVDILKTPTRVMTTRGKTTKQRVYKSPGLRKTLTKLYPKE